MSIIGQWRNTYIKITKHHNHGQNDTAKFEVNESTLPKKLNISALNTIFTIDGTYYSEYQNLQGNLTKGPSGKWIVKEDSVFLKQSKPTANVFKFKLKMQDSIATINGLINLDGEGKANDNCLAILKRLK